MKQVKYKVHSGIYTITNLINNKIYIGSTSFNLNHRKRQHFYELKNNTHDNQLLQRSYNKYGKENFVFEILEECPVEYCISKEQYWMNMLDVCNRKYGFNLARVAGSTSGYKHTDEAKEKISKIHKGKKLSLEQIELIRKVNSKPKSEETKKKMSLSQKGRIFSAETKQKMKDAWVLRRNRKELKS